MAYNDEENILRSQSSRSRNSVDFPDEIRADTDDHEPTNSEIMTEIRKNRQLMKLILAFTILTLITFIILSVFLYNIVGEYKDEVIDAFDTMRKVDGMVEQLEADYNNYSSKIDEFFDVVSELKSYLDNFKSVVGSLPSIQLPF